MPSRKVKGYRFFGSADTGERPHYPTAFDLRVDTDRAIKVAEENAKKFPKQRNMTVSLAMPVLIWLAIVCNQRTAKAIRKMFSDIADYNARVEDNFGGIRVVQAFTNEEHEKKIVRGQQHEFPAV